jgi:cyanophycinase
MSGGIVLAGGEEFRAGCEEMDTAIMDATGAKPAKVLIIPTAAVTGPQKAASDGVRHFSRLGAIASELMVLDRTRSNDEDFIKVVSDASIIYFTGGSPDHLLATLKGSKLFERLQEALARGAVVGGSSAGAMVMGSAMRRPSPREWVEGLSIVEGVAVLPHHERSDPDTVAKELAQTTSPDLKVLGIDARTCCFGTPGNWQALGSGKVTAYRNGSWATYNSGESLLQGF